jgi:hypothetical protein
MVLADAGQDLRPFANGPQVRACDTEELRAEFYRQYPADGTEKQKGETRRKAFRRCLTTATERELIAVRDIKDRQWVWQLRVNP